MNKSQLTDREIDILACLLNGRGVKKIAIILNISPKTVEAHLRNIMLKFKCNSRENLIDLVTNTTAFKSLQERYIEILTPSSKGEVQVDSFVTLPSISFTSGTFLEEVIIRNKKIFAMIILFIGICFLWILIKDPLFSSKTQTSWVLKQDLLLPHKVKFLDRKPLIKKIEAAIQSHPNEIQKIILVGVGGAGKTILARYYASVKEAKITWELNADSKENLLISLKKLAIALAQKEKNFATLTAIQDAKSAQQIEIRVISYIKEKFSKYSNWLLIFDNVNNLAEIQDYLPQNPKVWGKGDVIFTTRDLIIQNNHYLNTASIIHVGELNNDEKLELFNKILNNSTIDTTLQCTTFLENIPPFPLDISTAAHYLKITKIGYKEYLNRIEENSDAFNAAQKDILKDVGDYTKTRYNIMSLSIKCLMEENQEFGDLLLLIGLIDPQNIPRNLLNGHKNPVLVDNFIHALQKHSLLVNSIADKEDTISLHPSNQNIILNCLTKVWGVYNQMHRIERLAETVEKYTDNILVDNDLASIQLILTHLIAFLKHKKLLSELAQAILGSKLAQIDIRRQVEYPRAQSLLQKSLSVYQNYYQKSHPKVAWTLGQLGILSKVHGNQREQKKFFEESLIIYKNYYGTDDSIESAYVLVLLGNLCRRLGEFNKAQYCLEKGLLVYQKFYGESHIQTAWVLANLGRFYRCIGDYKKAKALLEKYISVYHNNPSKNEIELAWVNINLAIIYRSLGNIEKEKKLMEFGFSIYKKHYRDIDLDLCWASVHMGLTYGHLGNWVKSEELIVRNVEVFIHHFGENHAMTAWCIEKLGKVYSNLGEYYKADRCFNKALIVYKNNYGHESILVGLVEHSMGYNYFMWNNFITAEVFLKHAAKILKDTKYPKIYRTLESLANLYLTKASKEKNHIYRELYHQKSKNYFEECSNVYKRYFPSHYVLPIDKKKTLSFIN